MFQAEQLRSIKEHFGTIVQQQFDLHTADIKMHCFSCIIEISFTDESEPVSAITY